MRPLASQAVDASPPDTSTFEHSKPQYEEIQRLDPLKLDEVLRELPALTARRDLDTILTVLERVTSSFGSSILHTETASYAALRDLDFLINSAHAIEPEAYKTVPGLERFLQALGRAAKHTPRGCNFTYGLFNPAGDRMRTFTGLPEERFFIDAVKSGTHCLDEALIAVCALSRYPLDSPQFADTAANSIQYFDRMVQAADGVLRRVSPQVFSGHIVKYFGILNIDGKDYIGITGAQVQNVGLDYVLYGANLADPSYQCYAAEHISTLLPFHKQFIRRALTDLGEHSLISRIASDLSTARSIDEEHAASSLTSLDQLITSILTFRAVHRRLARPNLAIRMSGQGSGGSDMGILDYLLDRTRDCRTDIRRMADRVGKIGALPTEADALTRTQAVLDGLESTRCDVHL